MALAATLNKEKMAWVWLALALIDLFWELTAAFVHGTPWDHITLSGVIKRWEGIDPVTGKPVATPVGIIKRAFVGLGVIAFGVYLILHWVFQVIP